MANPAKDARDKMQAVWPGASVSARGRRSITHQHPTEPGRFALDTSIGPIHYGAGEDQEIDTAWVASAGAWDYEVTANDFHCFVRDSVPVGYRYLDVASGESVDLDVDAIEWVNDSEQRENVTSFSQVTPTIDDDSITWPDISAGWAVSVQAQTARLAKKIIIDSLANLGSPTLTGAVDLAISFKFQKSAGLDVYLDGVLWNENSSQLTNDHIEFRASGVSIFWFKRPWAADSGDGFLNGSMYVRKAGNNLFVEVRIPWAWLQAASYPIEIDPTIDEQVGAGADDAQEQTNNTGFSSTLTQLNHNSNTTDANTFHGGMRFQTVAVPKDATINGGTYCELYYNSAGVDDPDFDLWCEDVDDAVDFTSDADVVDRVKTTASAGPYTATGVGDPAAWWGSSIDASAPIQEIVQRDGWASGQDLCVIIKGSTRTTNVARCQTYEGAAGNAPKLHIDYTAAGGSVNQFLNRLFVRRIPAPRSRL